MAKTEGRLAMLDGLRGVAALAVVFLHGTEIFHWDWVPHQAYLAVDFFFLQSGYVIARVYDRRLSSGWIGGFVQQRLIRLYPLILIGSLIGFTVLMGRVVIRRDLPVVQVVLDLISSLLLLPTPPLVVPHFDFYPADPPVWSLFFELAANVLYAFIAPYLKGWRLWSLVALSGLVLAGTALALNGGDFGLDHFPFASFRVLFSFFFGVAVYRQWGDRFDTPRLPAAANSILFVVFGAILLAPLPISAWTYLVATFVAFPAIFLLALLTAPGGTVWRQACLLGGLLSYPVYIIHQPLFRALAMILAFLHKESAFKVFGLLSSVVLVMILSWILAKAYDEPVRRWLSGSIGGAKRFKPTLSPDQNTAP